MTNRPRTRQTALILPTALTLLAALASAPTATAQHILEVDLSAGRTIINDQWRSMGSVILAVDHGRGILYVNDAEEPEGIMAFSLATGERIRVLPTRESDGPHEFSQGHTGMTIGPGGKLYVSGLLRVVVFDSTGAGVGSWTPRAPTSKSVCNLGGQPAIPAQHGVIRRGPGGADEGIGPNVVNSHVLMARDREEGAAISDLIWNARIACTDDAATGRSRGPWSTRRRAAMPCCGSRCPIPPSGSPGSTRTAPWCSPGTPRRLRNREGRG
ncbi:MAG: hypothetical protein OXI76_12610 [Gemmatimonadota bacterium]|nr:hypothetical protein [Gemmatimonadota bacterium]